MDRQQLAHLLRAACRVVDDPEIVVLGSQSILGSFDEDHLPPRATGSLEADIAFLDDPDRTKADEVEAAIGEMSQFHREYGVYAEGIHVSTAILPDGWLGRAVRWNLQSSLPADARFLEPHDLAVAKLAAFREKDLAFVGALTHAGLLNLDLLRERAKRLPLGTDSRVVERISSWIDVAAGSDPSA